MKRLVIAAAALALTFGMATPASASEYTGNPWSVPLKAYGLYPAGQYPYPSTLPICITSTWAANYYHKPKTRVGHFCIATRRTWLPLNYSIWGYLYRHGTPVLLVQRVS